MLYGYARVSTNGQSLDAQLAALKAAGCVKVFAEKQSGVKTDRKELAKALAKLQAGDTLIVTKIDRLARSTLDLLNTIKAITTKGAGFKSLGDAVIDTTTAHGELMLGILAVLAQFERRLIIDRTSEGRAIAKANGVKFGRPGKLDIHQRTEALRRLATGAETLSDIGRSYRVSHTTIARLALAESYKHGPLLGRVIEDDAGAKLRVT